MTSLLRGLIRTFRNEVCINLCSSRGWYQSLDLDLSVNLSFVLSINLYRNKGWIRDEFFAAGEKRKEEEQFRATPWRLLSISAGGYFSACIPVSGGGVNPTVFAFCSSFGVRRRGRGQWMLGTESQKTFLDRLKLIETRIYKAKEYQRMVENNVALKSWIFSDSKARAICW